MVALSTASPLSSETLSVFYAKDPVLSDSRVFVLYGSSPTLNGAATSSSRVQSHVFTPAGFQSYQRLAVSPSSPLYKAVECLSREEQGDEVCRALAFSLLKYFSELPEIAKDTWVSQCLSTYHASSALKLFSESHAARLASQMTRIEDSQEAIAAIERLMFTQSISYVDVDVVLPPGSISNGDPSRESVDSADTITPGQEDRYGAYGELINLLGEPTFLPTSRMRRAPSKPANLNRTTTFSRSQKETLRREMCELVDTEENYVAKLYDLLHSVAAEFREKAAAKPSYSGSPSKEALSGLFPPSLDKILEVNSSFLEALRKTLDESEDEAIKDIESSNDSSVFQASRPLTLTEDPTGASAFSNLFLQWFPMFNDCYGDYIQAHGNFGEFIRSFMNETGSSFAKRVQETGEQRLMSMLIEPVQRLPRYSLYIDNIIKQLPSRHPALRNMMKAKDIINEICSQDQPSLQQSKVVNRLREIVSSWPPHFVPQSRLITAIDASLIDSPFGTQQLDDDCQKFIFVLFNQHLILVRRSANSSVSARGLLAKIDNLSSVSSEPHPNGDELTFVDWMELGDVNLTEMDSGNLLKLLRVRRKPQTAADATLLFYLDGPYEGKSGKWIKEVVKARVEGRFSESEREGLKWEAKMLEPTPQISLGTFSAIFEDAADHEEVGRGNPGAIRLVFDPVKCFKQVAAGESGIDIVASISGEGDGFYRLEIESTNERGTRDLVTTAEFVPVLTRRLGTLLQMKNQIRNPAIAPTLLQHYQDFLKSLSPSPDVGDQKSVRSRIRRPPSPVKALSSLFGGSPSKEIPPANPPQTSPTKLGRTPKLVPSSPIKLQQSIDTGNQAPHFPIGTRVVSKDISKGAVSIESLERTLNNYVLALHARKGNVVGRVVANRALAEEAAVNELYNTLLEQPDNHEHSAQAPVDVLFAAFEKFLKIAWKETLGPIIPGQTLEQMQAKAEILSPLDYEEYLSGTMAELAPQNGRALRSIINLLSELLDGTGNDGDRGILTAAITEIVVDEEDPFMYISLFDRFVVDPEVLGGTTSKSGAATPNFGSMNSAAMRSTNAGSIGSKASSFSKRFGLGSLRRENSQTESKFGSVLRSWSKAARPVDTTVKPVLNRTKSADLDAQLVNVSRPTSSHSVQGLSGPLDSRPSTARSTDRIDSPASRIETPRSTNTVIKKKRRSSLSDIRSLPAPNFSPFTVSPTLHKTPDRSKAALPSLATPDTPSPIKHTTKESPTRSRSFLDTLTAKKENVSPLPLRAQTVKEHARSFEEKSVSSDVENKITQKSTATLVDVFEGQLSNNRVPQGVLSERPASGNTPAPYTSPTKPQELGDSPRKLRMQSPQKLRERLQSQNNAIADAGSTLEDELHKIGQELKALNSGTGDDATGRLSRSPSKREESPIKDLSTRLEALENKVPGLIKDLHEHNSTLEKDMASSLAASNRKAKELEVQVQQTNAENDALYQRINDELSRIFTAVRGGQGVEELKQKMSEAQEEATRLRKENQRLKRENAGLRAVVNES